jgi:hypothetical protein
MIGSVCGMLHSAHHECQVHAPRVLKTLVQRTTRYRRRGSQVLPKEIGVDISVKAYVVHLRVRWARETFGVEVDPDRAVDCISDKS